MCKVCKRFQADILKSHRQEKVALQEEKDARQAWAGQGKTGECKTAEQAQKRAAAFQRLHEVNQFPYLQI